MIGERITKKVWRVGDNLMVSITQEEAEKLNIHEGDLVDVVHTQKGELHSAVRPEVQAALEQAMDEYAPDLEYLKDK